MRNPKTILSAATLATLALLVSADAPADLVPMLPQMDVFSFKLYSGYLPIAGTTKTLHYVFAQS